jgi:hypothetical protein
MDEFQFSTKFDQTLLLGRKARNVKELLEGIKAVPKSSIYYHTHKFLQEHHFLSPEPPNDFAYWVTNVLNDRILGEEFSSIGVVQFRHISDLRDKLVNITESYLQTADANRDAPRGGEFHFMASRTFVLKTPYIAHNLSEFREILKRVSVYSLYYHIFDAKLRLESEENDFSRWFRSLSQPVLADEVARLDPYTHTLEGLRKRIMVLVTKYDKD